MKILYNHQIFFQKYGGISRYFVELANDISLYKNKKVTVIIVCCNVFTVVAMPLI